MLRLRDFRTAKGICSPLDSGLNSADSGTYALWAMSTMLFHK